ncbi:hypothetical protein G6M89_05205 [Natronolimnobius sp. AArcel1]|uniref:DUF7504 family protein n=1 Tax=Natronolimnobius sp. AArcel1 TaxID=1679093 RepID=UPI0013EE39A3|nr:hypothetical protein [Natronolimnobius sp. AArcel1]NGM68410.1 hypothetical protein [Natronolimnobius sp. AArcel1]
MFSGPDSSGTASEGTFTTELRQLKHDGASVLVVGSLQPAHRRDICRRLFGDESDADTPRRRIAVSTTGRPVWPSLEADSTTATYRHITYDAPARGSVASQPPSTADNTGSDSPATPSAPDGPDAPNASEPAGSTTATANSSTVAPSRVTVDTLADLGIAISSAIEYFDTDAGGLEPAELRVGIDSLLPLLEATDRETVFTFLHLTTGRATAADGMVHCHLPVERDATVVSVFSSLFDIVLEVRAHPEGYEERWRVTDSACDDTHHSHWITRNPQES